MRTIAPSWLIRSASAGRHTSLTVCPASANLAASSEPYDAPKIRILYFLLMKSHPPGGLNIGKRRIPDYGFRPHVRLRSRNAIHYVVPAQSCRRCDGLADMGGGGH